MENQPDRRPLPPEIYMRRRVAALVIILVVVVLVVGGLVAWARSGSSDDVKDTTPETPTEQVVTEPTVPEPTDTETTSASSSAEATTSPGSSTPETTEPAANAEGKDTCELGDLRIEASTSKPGYAVGEQPDFYMKVDNPTKADCQIDLDKDKLRFEVYEMNNNQRIWSDTDCYPPLVDGQETFKAGESRNFQARWSATNSQPGQCSNREPVAPGSYFLHAVIGNNASNPTDFTIR